MNRSERARLRLYTAFRSTEWEW